MKGSAPMLARLFPAQADNRFDGYRAALWLLGLFIALKLVIGFNSILNTASVAAGADGIPLDSFGPAAGSEVLKLFALTSLGQLTLTIVALTILLRYRALVPFIYLVLIGEHLARRAIVQGHAAEPTVGTSPGLYINLGLLALLTLGLLLSLVPARKRKGSDPLADRSPRL